MGKLIEGKWLTDEELLAFEEKQYGDSNGRFIRGSAVFRNWVTVDGSAGISGKAGFVAQAGRYHLYAALNCPWAHRTLLFRKLKQLDNVVSLSLVKPARTEKGWVFDSSSSRFYDSLHGLDSMYKLYQMADADFSGRVTVPVLWDKQELTIVSNESSEIIRMFNSAFNDITSDKNDFYPAHLAREIDDLNEYIFHNVNNGVYKTGFARTQEAYDESVVQVFCALDRLEERLSTSQFLFGEQTTESDWRLFPTLARFDVGYYSAFKCNIKALRDYPHLSRYLSQLYAIPGIADTVDVDVYRQGYHSISPLRNPHGIVPVGFESVFSHSLK